MKEILVPPSIHNITPQAFWVKSSSLRNEVNRPAWRRWAEFAFKHFEPFLTHLSKKQLKRLQKTGDRPRCGLQAAIEVLDKEIYHAE